MQRTIAAVKWPKRQRRSVRPTEIELEIVKDVGKEMVELWKLKTAATERGLRGILQYYDQGYICGKSGNHYTYETCVAVLADDTCDHEGIKQKLSETKDPMALYLKDNYRNRTQILVMEEMSRHTEHAINKMTKAARFQMYVDYSNNIKIANTGKGAPFAEAARATQQIYQSGSEAALNGEALGSNYTDKAAGISPIKIRRTGSAGRTRKSPQKMSSIPAKQTSSSPTDEAA